MTDSAKSSLQISTLIAFCLTALAVSMPAWGGAATLASVTNNGRGGTFELAAGQTYTGGILFVADTKIIGHGATIELGPDEFIRIGSGTNVIFRDLTINQGNGIALGFDGSSPARFTGERLTITGTTGSGIEADRGILNLTDCVITGRTFGIYCYNEAVIESLIGCNISGQSDSGIFLNKASALNIRHTRIANCLKNGVLALDSPKVVLANCVIEDHLNSSQAFGLSLQNSANVSIGEGTVVRHSDRGIFLRNCQNAVISDTSVMDCYYLDGISLQEGSSAVVERCEVSLCQAGVAVVKGSSATIIDSFLHNNLVKQTSAILGQGIYLNEAGSVTVMGCTITDNDNEGIYAKNSDMLIVENSRIMENGWVAKDGNGIYCDNTPGVIRNNKINHNFMKGVLTRKVAATIEGNEIRRNGEGGIAIIDTAGQTVNVNQNLLRANGITGGTYEELNASGTGTSINAANNLFSSNDNIGVLAQNGAMINLTGNIIRNNAKNGVNLYKGNARLRDNVVFGSNRNVYHNESNTSEGSFNDIYGASVSGVEAINLSSGPLNYPNNWWGDAMGPRTSSSPAAEGVLVQNVNYDPWLDESLSEIAVFENMVIGEGEWFSQCANGMAWAKFWIHSTGAMDGQYLSAQASRRNHFPHVPLTFDVPAGTIYLNVLGSHEIRRQQQAAIIELAKDSENFPNLETVKALKYNARTEKWDTVRLRIDAEHNVVQLLVDDLQGYYLIAPNGGLTTGQVVSSGFIVY